MHRGHLLNSYKIGPFSQTRFKAGQVLLVLESGRPALKWATGFKAV